MKLLISIIFTFIGSIACATNVAQTQGSGAYDKKDCDTMVSVSLSTRFHHDESSNFMYKSSKRTQEIGDLIMYDVQTTLDHDETEEQRWLAVAEKVYDIKTQQFLFCGVANLIRNKITYKK